MHQHKYPVLGSRHIACCKLASTLARQMWRHNDVIDRNEYLIFTLLESVNPWVYSLQFLFKSTNDSLRYERKCEWLFFFWTQCTFIATKWLVTTSSYKFWIALNFWSKGNHAISKNVCQGHSPKFLDPLAVHLNYWSDQKSLWLKMVRTSSIRMPSM